MFSCIKMSHPEKGVGSVVHWTQLECCIEVS